MTTSPAGALIDSDTIVALATPPGRGAIAVIRLSGPDAERIAGHHLSPWPVEPRAVTLCEVHDRERKLLEQALVTLFVAPNSYTGENVVEISTHGGDLSPALVMEELVASGARPAAPGEFTRRAVLNGKMDLLQAEAVADLIDSASRPMREAALSQLDGGLSRRVADLRDRMLEVESLIAYDIDFPEEDDGPVPRERIQLAVESAQAALDALLDTAPRGELIRSGAVVVIAGEPNVGKSSLFNALLGRSRAIVTDVPGTTRDAIEAVIDGERWPLRLVDTAGIRETSDAVERLGVELSRQHVQGAHVVLACGDADASLASVLESVLGPGTGAAVIAVRTKIDLAPPGLTAKNGSRVVEVSASSGAGLKQLLERIDAELSARYGRGGLDAPVVTRARHRAILTAASAELAEFRAGWTSSALPATVAAVHLRSAIHFLEELIGSVDVEDVLDRVFSSFCVGK
ncbi:MAG TPA: tRNA uridine-5-carboxymethylaminomethyl(34) synthesis GTPase MnmE [Gemmatimonadaceae bacterium]|nr:tRNA uridine-5-carboxymethylaminomethyl(34) synthesis GTPase MnmE [Gemmatimonadaceae bacterium]